MNNVTLHTLSHYSDIPFISPIQITMLSQVLLYCADTGKTSKVNPMLYPAEVIAENFISDVKNKEMIQTTKSFFGKRKRIKDHCQWKGVKCRNATMTIAKWSNMGLVGSFAFQWCPQELGVLDASKNRLTGSLTLADLPREIMKSVSLEYNRMIGTIDFLNMPPCMQEFNIRGNQFHGSVEIDNVNANMFDISENKFSGSFDFRKLAETAIEIFNISDNEFSGTADFPKIEACYSMRQFSIRKNGFDGVIDISRLPLDSLELFDISENNFEGTVDLNWFGFARTFGLYHLDLSLNRLAVIGQEAIQVEHSFYFAQQGEEDAPVGPREIVVRVVG